MRCDEIRKKEENEIKRSQESPREKRKREKKSLRR